MLEKRVGIVSMLCPNSLRECDYRIRSWKPDGVNEEYKFGWCVHPRVKWTRIVPLDRWEEITKMELPHTFTCIGSIRYDPAPHLQEIALPILPNIPAWFVTTEIPNLATPEPIQIVRLRRERFVWDVKHPEESERCLVAGGEEIKLLRKTGSFKTVYQKKEGNDSYIHLS